jgi:hypothetical protein
LKTAASCLRSLVAAALLFASGGAGAAGNVSFEADGRLRLAEGAEREAELHLLGLSLRHAFADSKGDRLILAGLARAESDLSEITLHELYARYKGPLGSWDLTAGRFRLPYGLMYSFDPATLLYNTPHMDLLGMDSDNGAMLSGLVGPFDYALSFTQGYGHHAPDFPGHGIAMARLGIIPGETEEVSIGFSGAYGRTLAEHDGDETIERAIAGADATLYLGRWLSRLELSGGRVDGQEILAGFAGLDYALLSGLDLNLAANVVRHGSETADTWFAGITCRPRWITIRGGYQYEGTGDSHEFTIQAYYMFSRGY